MTKLKLSATLSEDDLRSISEWSARQRDAAKEQGRREGIEEVAVWLEGKSASPPEPPGLDERGSMRSKRFLQDQRQLLDHAEEARTRAEAMTDADSKIRMLGIAEGYEKQARREKTLAGVKFNPKLDVEATSDSIVITLLGTIYSVTYFMRMGSSGLLARDIANKDDPRVSMTCPDFLVSAWRAANERAKGLGWIA